MSSGTETSGVEEEMNGTVSIIGLIVEIVIIVATVRVAQGKGRSAVLWGILAFLFSFIALIIVAVPPSNRS